MTKRFSHRISTFHGIQAPEEGTLAGYGAIIEAYTLTLPLPGVLTLISDLNRRYFHGPWQVLPSRYLPEDNLYKQLIFALKYEGVNLLAFKKLFQALGKNEVEELVQIEPLGQFSRRIWFLYEWLHEEQLDIPDLRSGNYVTVVDDKLQFTIKGSRSPRHRIINNIPGTSHFCPLIKKTDTLLKYTSSELPDRARESLGAIHKDILLRTSAFLLLKDSRASFIIEGESIKNRRMGRWAHALGQAGAQRVSKDELIRLQQILIENPRFVQLGFRTKGGFIGEHDRATFLPIPDHISAKWEDIDSLMQGLIATYELLIESEFDPVLAAALISFGFVFIHPFTDGNGRIHRYLIHHVLSQKAFTPQGIIFPVSASMLERIEDYRHVLQSYSHPLLDFIEWETTNDNNIEVLNDTIDYYRYYDATKQAEFLYDCVIDTIDRIIPEEVQYLIRYDEFKHYLDNIFEMPDKTVALLVHFLEQNNGKLSRRAREKEFAPLTNKEVLDIENAYQSIFNNE